LIGAWAEEEEVLLQRFGKMAPRRGGLLDADQGRGPGRGSWSTGRLAARWSGAGAVLGASGAGGGHGAAGGGGREMREGPADKWVPQITGPRTRRPAGVFMRIEPR
jgi:hypothetical protein